MIGARKRGGSAFATVSQRARDEDSEEMHREMAPAKQSRVCRNTEPKTKAGVRVDRRAKPLTSSRRGCRAALRLPRRLRADAWKLNLPFNRHEGQ